VAGLPVTTPLPVFLASAPFDPEPFEAVLAEAE
jgi:hypothetical protein